MRAAPQKSSAESTPRSDMVAALTKLWLGATATWGHRWTTTCGDLPIDRNAQLTVAAQLWAKGLAEFTEREILGALAAFVTAGADWPPNLPDFRRQCFGIPSFAAVNEEILTQVNADRSPFARLVWQQIDGYQHRHASARDAERMRRDAYARATEYVLAGGALPGPIAGELEHQQPLPIGIPPTREERVERMRKLLGSAFSERAANRRERV